MKDTRPKQGIAREKEPAHKDRVLEPEGLATGHSDDFLVGGGEMAERMRAMDWSRTALGPMEQWPQSLKTSVSICLASRFPIVMYWGPEYVVLYNDAYSTVLGSKHPWALGQRCRDCWAEIWDTIGPMLDSVVETAQATWSDDLLLLLHRHAYPEECYFSFSFSPIRIETGAVGGVFTAVMETTDKVIGERRLRTLRDLAARAVDAKSESGAWRIAAETLAENLQDIPFAVLCQASGPDSRVRVLATAGIEATHPLCASLCASDSKLLEHLRGVAHSREMFELKDLGEAGGDLPRGAWEVPPQSVLVLPIADLGQERVSGVLVAAVSPRKVLDESYRTFFQLVARQIATSVADARSHDEERKRAEALAEIDRAKTLFFSNVSHEFRTPLTLMLGPLEDTLARAEGRLSQEDQERLAVVHRNSLRLLKLVNTLLDFSRIEAGRVEALYEPTDLCTLTRELASLFRAAMEKAGLRFEVECDPLPEPVYVDRAMWEKIVLNLLSNAFKYTFEGEVAVSLKAVDGAVVLQVKDSGTGIPEHELPRLFERFHRVEGSRGRTYEGTGIGLALVQELAKLHGGTVAVQSKLGQGSTFTVSIPRGKDHLPSDRLEGVRTSASTALRTDSYVEETMRWLPQESGDVVRGSNVAQNLPSLNTANSLVPPSPETESSREVILLADDNADMREYVRGLLSARYTVHAVSNGEEALGKIRQIDPDLVLTDVMMPGLDGFGLLRAIRQDPSRSAKPVILLSARAGEESRVEGLDAGADDYLIKPFTARELLARVGAHLTMAGIRREAAEREKRLRDEAELERCRLQEVLQQVPAAIGITSGPQHRWTFVNQGMLEVTGRQRAEDFIGRTVHESIPEIENQGYLELLDRVYRTGAPFVGMEMKVVLQRGARPRDEGYFNFVYQPLRNVSGGVEGILVHAVEVTQQVLARQSIERSEERLRLAQAAAQIGTWEWDPANNSSSLSPELENLFGIESSGVQHREKWASRIFPEDKPRVMAEMDAARRTESMEFEYRYQHPERGLRWFYCKGRRFSREESDSMFGVVLDITERKRLEEASQKAHDDLDVRVQQRTAELASATEELKGQAQLLHLAHDAIIVRDLRNAISFWNLGAQKTYGWSSQEAVGQVTHVLLATQFPEPLEDIERKLVESGSWEGELVHRRKDGSQIFVESRWVLEFDAQRRPVRILEINRDVTLRRRAEERVVEQAQLLDLANDAIFVRTMDSKLTYWNRGAERLYGWKKHEVLGRLVPDILHTEFPIPLPDIMEHLAKHGDWEGELTHSKRDGTRIMVFSRWTLWRDNSGMPLGYLEINSDITVRKVAEQNLRMLSARLLQLQDEERRRIARELHDSAGQLLVALDLNIASIQRESRKFEPGIAARIAESKQLVQELSKELRTISHLLHPPLLDEAGLPSAVRWYVDGFARRSKIPVKLELSPDLGRLPRDLETTIFRIVQECLTNVHRHAQSPSAEIHILRMGDRVIVEIRDEGKGMPAETEKSSSKPFLPGVGIQGMRERVRQLGGQLEIQSVDPQGTLIRATLPAGEWISDSTEETLGAAS